jgi:hypothetical protein
METAPFVPTNIMKYPEVRILTAVHVFNSRCRYVSIFNNKENLRENGTNEVTSNVSAIFVQQSINFQNTGYVSSQHGNRKESSDSGNVTAVAV